MRKIGSFHDISTNSLICVLLPWLPSCMLYLFLFSVDEEGDSCQHRGQFRLSSTGTTACWMYITRFKIFHCYFIVFQKRFIPKLRMKLRFKKFPTSYSVEQLTYQSIEPLDCHIKKKSLIFLQKYLPGSFSLLLKVTNWGARGWHSVFPDHVNLKMLKLHGSCQVYHLGIPSS